MLHIGTSKHSTKITSAIISDTLSIKRIYSLETACDHVTDGTTYHDKQVRTGNSNVYLLLLEKLTKPLLLCIWLHIIEITHFEL